MKKIYKYIPLVMAAGLFIYLSVLANKMPNALRDAAGGIYNSDIDLEFEVNVIGIVDNNRFMAESFGFDEPFMVVSQNPIDISPGTVDIHGYFIDKGIFKGTFILKNYRMMRFHAMKYILSFIGFIIFLFIFFKEWKITKKGFAERKNA